MEISSAKSAHKFVKSGSQTGVVRYISPQEVTKNHSWPRDEAKEKQNKNKVSHKSPPKENTKPQDFKLHTQQRAVKRALFNYTVATKIYLIEQHKRRVERIQKLIEEEEIRMLRKEMVPRAQLMPFFDRPFFPQRSSRPLTVPREPSFGMLGTKCSSRFSSTQLHNFHHNEAH